LTVIGQFLTLTASSILLLLIVDHALNKNGLWSSLHRQNVGTRIKFGAHQCFSTGAFTSNVLSGKIIQI